MWRQLPEEGQHHQWGGLVQLHWRYGRRGAWAGAGDGEGVGRGGLQEGVRRRGTWGRGWRGAANISSRQLFVGTGFWNFWDVGEQQHVHPGLCGCDVASVLAAVLRTFPVTGVAGPYSTPPPPVLWGDFVSVDLE